jgi:hypothetical protein
VKAALVYTSHYMLAVYDYLNAHFGRPRDAPLYSYGNLFHHLKKVTILNFQTYRDVSRRPSNLEIKCGILAYKRTDRFST